MIRSIYCPSLDKFDEAHTLATKAQLQILIGDSELTKKLEFDRNRVCIISIPNEHCLVLHQPTVQPNMAQVIEYINDFCDLTKSKMVVYVDDNIVNPQIIEKHKSRYLYRTPVHGNHRVRIFVDDIVTAEEEYEVLP